MEVIEDEDQRSSPRGGFQKARERVEKAESRLRRRQVATSRETGQPFADIGDGIRHVCRARAEFRAHRVGVDPVQIPADDLNPWPEG